MAFSAVLTGTCAAFAFASGLYLLQGFTPVSAIIWGFFLGQVTFGLTIAKALLCRSLRERRHSLTPVFG